MDKEVRPKFWVNGGRDLGQESEYHVRSQRSKDKWNPGSCLLVASSPPRARASRSRGRKRVWSVLQRKLKTEESCAWETGRWGASRCSGEN